MDDTGNIIYNDYGVSVVADGNYWGNLNPTTNNLVNFVVDDYYLFKINSDKRRVLVGEVLNLCVGLGLNTTGLDPWTGPEIDIGDYI